MQNDCKKQCPKLSPFATHFLFCLPRNRVHKELCLLLFSSNLWFSWSVIFLLFTEPWGQEVLYFCLYHRKNEAQAWRWEQLRLLQSQGPWSRGPGELSEEDSCSSAPASGGQAALWVSAPGLPRFSRKAGNPDLYRKFPGEICSRI